VWQSFLSIFPHLLGGTMATSQRCCHLPGEMLNSAAECADRARIKEPVQWHIFGSFVGNVDFCYSINVVEDLNLDKFQFCGAVSNSEIGWLVWFFVSMLSTKKGMSSGRFYRSSHSAEIELRNRLRTYHTACMWHSLQCSWIGIFDCGKWHFLKNQDMQHSHPRQHFDRLLRENNNTYVKIHTVGNLYLKYKMSTSHKSIETTAKVMLHEFFDAQISAEHIVCVICSVDDCSVCTGPCPF
jgi:hypothetical protein